MARRRIAVLGSTGSIGRGVLDVVARLPEAFEVVSLAASTSAALLAEQAARFGARRVAVGADTRGDFGPGVRVLRGPAGLEELAGDPDADLVVNAVVGASGLRPTMAALRAGKLLALANKESLVMAGEIVTRTAREAGGEIVPIDSEHSAIFRSLAAARRGEVTSLVLTASGGALRDVPVERVGDVTVAEVLRHPTWSMGAKVTVDSATLVNKALEVIEARWLFDVPLDRIGIVMHRESVVHSLVRLSDGSFLAHLGEPDMRIPIQYALCYPEPGALDLGSWSPGESRQLSFEDVDPRRYPALGIVLRAAEAGGTAPAAAAAADEVAVEAFIAGRVRFADIARIIEETVSRTPDGPCGSVEDVLEADARAREIARTCAGGAHASRAGGGGSAATPTGAR
ncbi:MAG: 1-deoxy-D-xylulose-5-phosphate reductoisomerase [Candidatus Eisenbacteria bacterium]|nr:1-deoxy-D-xylulose-5-phosphate reductoisomerase [Candidatus Eisenbacteria bacterium]